MLRLHLRQLSQHRVQDAAVAVALDLDGGVDTASGDEVDPLAVGLERRDLDGLTRFQVVVESDLEGFGAVEIKEFSRFTFAELQRQDTHADEVRAVDALE